MNSLGRAAEDSPGNTNENSPQYHFHLCEAEYMYQPTKKNSLFS